MISVLAHFDFRINVRHIEKIHTYQHQTEGDDHCLGHRYDRRRGVHQGPKVRGPYYLVRLPFQNLELDFKIFPDLLFEEAKEDIPFKKPQFQFHEKIYITFFREIEIPGYSVKTDRIYHTFLQ